MNETTKTPDLMDMDAIKRINERNGRHFFSPSTMRFFSSRTAQVGYIGTSGKRVYFVTSEQFDYSSPRLYTVRMMDLSNGRENTVGEFQQYASRNGADKAAQRAALEDTND